MSTNKNLFKEAIADAKAVREAALVNAKEALHEALTPKLQSMLSAKLQEMESEEEMEESFKSAHAEHEGENLDFNLEENEDELEEDFDLSEILAELEEEDEEEELEESKLLNINEAEEESEEESEEEEDGDEEVGKMSVEDLKDLITSIIHNELEQEEEETPADEESEEEAGEEAGNEDEIDLEELLAELDEMEYEEDGISEAKKKKESELKVSEKELGYKKAPKGRMNEESSEEDKKKVTITLNEYINGDPGTYEIGKWVCEMIPALKNIGTSGDIGQTFVDIGTAVISLASVGTLVAGGVIAAHAQEIKSAAKKLVSFVSGKKDVKEGTEADQELATAVAKLPKDVVAKIAQKGKTSDMHEVEEEKEEMEEALATIHTLRNELNETNLLNAKLLYVNKIFKAKNLTESQKLKVIASFDKATTVKEAKIVFESLSNSISTPAKKAIKESFGFASKAAGVAPNRTIVESNDVITRMQKLANIIK